MAEERTTGLRPTIEGTQFLLFATQVALSCILVLVSLYHMSEKACENKAMWYSLFTGSVAYLLPNPTIKLEHKQEKKTDEAGGPENVPVLN